MENMLIYDTKKVLSASKGKDSNNSYNSEQAGTVFPVIPLRRYHHIFLHKESLPEFLSFRILMYCDAVIPTMLLKCRVKEVWLLKPDSA